MKRVLVTGGTGFIGRHTIPYLIKRGYEVHILSRQEGKKDGVHSHCCDLFDEKQLRATIKDIQPSHLLHLAWYVEHGKFYDAIENLFWVEASLRLVRIFAEHGGRRVAITGTCAEYDWSQGLVSETDTPLKPTSKYAFAKHNLMQLLTYFSGSLQLSMAWCRMFFLYGPFEQPSRLVPYIINQILSDKEVAISNRTSSRDFLYIEDAADAVVATLDSNFEGPINIASGNAYSVGSIANEISRYLINEAISDDGDDACSGQNTDILRADISQLREAVGFRPTYDLSAGIEKTVDWWKTQLQYQNDK